MAVKATIALATFALKNEVITLTRCCGQSANITKRVNHSRRSPTPSKSTIFCSIERPKYLNVAISGCKGCIIPTHNMKILF